MTDEEYNCSKVDLLSTVTLHISQRESVSIEVTYKAAGLEFADQSYFTRKEKACQHIDRKHQANIAINSSKSMKSTKHQAMSNG